MEHPREEPDTQQHDDSSDAHFQTVMKASIDDYVNGRFIDFDF